MASDELKPCPFCGGEAQMTLNFRGVEYGYRLTHRCEVIGSISFDWSSRDALTKRWNTRAQDFDAMRQRAEKAEQALHEIRHANMNGPVSENNAGCIKRIEQIAERALAGVKEAKHDQVCS